jgi:hypothetical protein
LARPELLVNLSMQALVSLTWALVVSLKPQDTAELELRAVLIACNTRMFLTRIWETIKEPHQ